MESSNKEREAKYTDIEKRSKHSRPVTGKKEIEHENTHKDKHINYWEKKDMKKEKKMT